MHQPGISVDFDWVEYLNLAKELVNDERLTSSREAKLRSAISRAYYAVFHKARSIVLPANKSIGFNSHQEVIDTLQRSDDSAQRQMGVNLARLKVHRVKADYN